MVVLPVMSSYPPKGIIFVLSILLRRLQCYTNRGARMSQTRSLPLAVAADIADTGQRAPWSTLHGRGRVTERRVVEVGAKFARFLVLGQINPGQIAKLTLAHG